MGTLITNVILVIQWILVVSTYEAGAACDYYKELIATENFYVSSPGYPNPYTQQTHCEWRLKTAMGTQIYLSCTVNLPWSDNCKSDNLYVSRTGNPNDAVVHCGSESFSLVSTGTEMALAFNAPYYTKGGSFVCTATVLKINTPNEIEQKQSYSNCDCGWTQMNRIVNGVETGVNEFPYMAAIIYEEELLCGSTLISDRFALTAAHCVLKKTVTDMFLLVGDHNIKKGDDTTHSALYQIDAYEINPQYDSSNQKNDIAILRSKTQIIFSPFVGPICLPFKSSFNSFDGQSVTILGWGSLEFTGALSDVLQKAQMYVVSTRQCATMQKEVIYDGEICTFSNNHSDSCQNDSGGPVLWYDTDSQRYVLIGIISHGLGCASANPGINTRVSEYLTWIVQRTNGYYCIK